VQGSLAAAALMAARDRVLLERCGVAQRRRQGLGNPPALPELHAARRGQHALHPSRDGAAARVRYTRASLCAAAHAARAQIGALLIVAL